MLKTSCGSRLTNSNPVDLQWAQESTQFNIVLGIIMPSCQVLIIHHPDDKNGNFQIMYVEMLLAKRDQSHPT